MGFNAQDTAIVVTDPQNDFLSPDGVTWELVGGSVEANGTVEHIEQLEVLVIDGLLRGICLTDEGHRADRDDAEVPETRACHGLWLLWAAPPASRRKWFGESSCNLTSGLRRFLRPLERPAATASTPATVFSRKTQHSLIR